MDHLVRMNSKRSMFRLFKEAPALKLLNPQWTLSCHEGLGCALLKLGKPATMMRQGSNCA